MTPRRTAALWVDESRDMLVGIAAMRSLGRAADDAVDAALALQPIARLRSSWELAVALGADLARTLSPADVELLERAFATRPRLVLLTTRA